VTPSTDHKDISVHLQQGLKHSYAAETEVAFLSHAASAQISQEAAKGTSNLKVDTLLTFHNGDQISIIDNDTFGNMNNSIASLDLDTGTVQLETPLSNTVPQGAIIVKQLSSKVSTCNSSTGAASTGTTSLIGQVGAGAHRLPVECVSEFTVKDTVRITSYNHSETGTIKRLRSSSIWLDAPLQSTYHAGDSVDIVTPTTTPETVGTVQTTTTSGPSPARRPTLFMFVLFLTLRRGSG
jgi:hypothetical protein